MFAKLKVFSKQYADSVKVLLIPLVALMKLNSFSLSASLSVLLRLSKL
ncbi:Uncharacterised protein [Segatella copri]|nr:Uncharacterised protein [Segatella copri]